MICRKLKLKKGDKILDIGCGWGSFLIYAAQKYKIQGVGLSISKEQINYANKIKNGLPLIFKLQDYKNYMKIINNNLKEDGLFLLHTIGTNKTKFTPDPWIEKYIFPNSILPSAKQITSASENYFIIEDWHNFGIQYYKTLMAWYNNFQNAWKELKNIYDEKFYRMWKFYLLSSAGNFKARTAQVWQIVFSKKGVKEGYKRPC